MKNISGWVVSIIFVIGLAAAILGVLVGGGWILSAIIHFTLFEGTLIFSVFSIGVVIISGVLILDKNLGVLKKIELMFGLEDEEHLCDDCAKENQSKQKPSNVVRFSEKFNASNISNNSVCLCGSGRKFKRCCGADRELS